MTIDFDSIKPLHVMSQFSALLWGSRKKNPSSETFKRQITQAGGKCPNSEKSEKLWLFLILPCYHNEWVKTGPSVTYMTLAV